MFLTIMSYIITGGAPLAIYLGYLKYINRNTPKVLTKSPEETESYPSGLSIIEYNIPPETEDEYLSRLKIIHREAWSAYQHDYKDKSILTEQDRFVNILMLKQRNGELEATIRTHTLNFSDGTELWIANKYYSYGNIWRCKRPGMAFANSSGRLSPYTFMSIVDLEMELSNYASWKALHDNYSRKRLSSLKHKLGIK